MIGRILLIIICSAVLLIGSEGRSVPKNGRSVLKLKLSQDDLNRGVAIQITGKANNKKVHELNHVVPSTMRQHKIHQLKKKLGNRLANRIKARKTTHSLSKLIKSLAPKKMEDKTTLNLSQRAHENSVVVPTVHSLRIKRSEPSTEKSSLKEREQTEIVDDMDKFNADDDMIKDVDDYFSEEESDKIVPKQYKGPQSQTPKPSKFVKSEDYGDYAFDTTDTDQFNEDDDLLRRYYNHPAVRRAAFDDYDSFSDIMHAAAAESDHDKRFVKRLHYGDQNNFLNDDVEDEIEDENDTNKEFGDDYDSYEDY